VGQDLQVGMTLGGVILLKSPEVQGGVAPEEVQGPRDEALRGGRGKGVVTQTMAMIPQAPV